MSRSGKPCRDHLGNQFPSVSQMTRHYGVNPATLCHRLSRGASLAQALDPSPRPSGGAKPCKDHLGNEYPSQISMLRTYGLNQTVFDYRHNTKKWSLEKTLTTPVADTDLAGAHKCRDHLGNEFPSKKAMCDFWRVPRNVFFARLRKGWPLEQCLDPNTKTRKTQARKVRDHLGREHRNLDAMCAAWNISKDQYMINIRNNLNLKQALTSRTARPKRPRDHTGAEYPSINAMCQAWGITKTTLRSRLELGWDLRSILTNPENNSHRIKCTDHLGNEFPDQQSMLAYHNVNYVTYKHRLSKGCSLAEALSPKSLHEITSSDGEREFPCLAAMLEFWLMATGTYHHRTGKLGMRPEQAIRTIYPGKGPLPGTEIRRTLSGFLDAVIDGRRYILSERAYMSELRRRKLMVLIENGLVPEGMRVRPVRHAYFHVSGGIAGSGVVAGPDMALYAVCLEKYKGRRQRSADLQHDKNPDPNQDQQESEVSERHEQE